MKHVFFIECNMVVDDLMQESSPTHIYIEPDDKKGAITTCWEVNDAELEIIKKTKRVWITIFTYKKNPLLPMAVSIDSPFISTVYFSCPRCNAEIDITNVKNYQEIKCEGCKETFIHIDNDLIPPEEM